MPNIQAISVEHHAGKRWNRFTSYAFAAADAVCPLVMSELPKALMAVPIAFVKIEDNYAMVALQGLSPGKNLLVSADGRWLARYVPEHYLCYPFLLVDGQNDEQLLCIDEDSGLVTEDTFGENFFDADNKPSPLISEILDFLTRNYASRSATISVCKQLDDLGLIKPWPVRVPSESGERNVDGIFCIDEQALNDLSADDLSRLQKSGGLSASYCQLLSMLHIKQLMKLEQATANSNSPNLSDELSFENLEEGGTISFDNL